MKFNIPTDIPASFYRHWHEEVKHEVSKIFFIHNLRIAKPNVMIDDHLPDWGRWNRISRTIVLSTRLIFYCTWDAVVETIRHEIAHQIVDEAFHLEEAQPHGPEFRQACRMLGISSKARASDADMGIPLDQRGAEKTKSDSILDKVRKLLALSGSMNEHEAGEAMRKANELLARHQLDLSDSHSEDDCDYFRIELDRERVATQIVLICNLLQDFFFANWIIIPSYCARTLRRTKAIEIMARKDNIEMARYVYYFLTRQCENLWLHYQAANPQASGITAKKSYIYGVLNGFRNTLDEERSRHVSSTALIQKSELELSEYLSYRYPKVRTKARHGNPVNSNMYSHGQRDGKNITINRPLRQEQGMGLLPGRLN